MFPSPFCLRRLHRDERGMEAMQAVIIVGVAALILALVFSQRSVLIAKVRALVAKIMS